MSVFNDIYASKSWSGSESVSGAGSGIDATENVRRELPRILKQYGCRSILDCPCGDFLWMSALGIGSLVDSYTGVDIVPDLIANNQRTHFSSSVRFMRLDIASEIPPQADIILCRHLLIHLPIQTCLRVVENFRKSGAKYLLITHQPDISENTDTRVGGYAGRNLSLPPFYNAWPFTHCESVSDATGPGDAAQLSLYRMN